MTDFMLAQPCGIIASASFTPAAAAYSAADILDVAKEFTFTDRDGRSVAPGSLIRILSAVVKIDQAAVISGETSYSLQMYSATPPSAQADNAAWTLASGDLSLYRGSLLLGTPADLGAACYIKTQYTDQQDIHLTTGKSSLFGQLITAGAATFTAVARQVFLYGVAL
jgi:hypothetical protein